MAQEQREQGKRGSESAGRREDGKRQHDGGYSNRQRTGNNYHGGNTNRNFTNKPRYSGNKEYSFATNDAKSGERGEYPHNTDKPRRGGEGANPRYGRPAGGNGDARRGEYSANRGDGHT